MNCVACDAKLPAGKKFCGICGASQSVAAPSAAATEVIAKAEETEGAPDANKHPKKVGLFIGIGTALVVAISVGTIWLLTPKTPSAADFLAEASTSASAPPSPSASPTQSSATAAKVDISRFNCSSFLPLMDDGWATFEGGTDAPSALMCWFSAPDVQSIFRFNVDYATESRWLEWAAEINQDGSYMDFGALVPGSHVLGKMQTDQDTGFTWTEYQVWIDGFAIDTNTPIAGVAIQDALNLFHSQITK